MRREEYERSYGRRSHVPPPLPSPQEDPRSRRSRTKMKCLISIGLILPALAAVIGVAAWAVSADVVMNSANSRSNKVDNSLLQGFSMGNDNRPDIFRNNEENQRLQSQTEAVAPTTKRTSTTSTSTTSTTSTTTTTTTVAPQTLSPKDASDVNAILSKLISASGAVSGNNGPRFVVVAPLPDHPDPLNSQPTISRADSHGSESPSNKDKDNAWQPTKEEQTEDLVVSGSSQSYSVAKPSPQASSQHLLRNGNSTNRGSSSKSEATRRIGEKPLLIHMANNNRRTSSGFNSQPLELTGFEPFDSMMQSESVMSSNSHIPQTPQNPSPNFPSSFKRGPPQGFYSSRNPHKPLQHFEMKDQHLFNGPHMHEHGVHNFNMNPRPQMMASHQHAIGLKPIQHQLHHMENGNGPQPEESRWGAVGFVPPPSSYVPKPPEGISLSISSPANSGTHVSSEPVSVIKSFFLPFLPKPRLNMNARVVFGVVLDKGMGIGGKKEAPRHPYH